MATRTVKAEAVRLAGRSPAVATLATALDRVGRGQPDVLGVLTYHRVSTAEESPWLHPGLISTTPEGFAAQMEFLASRYRVVSLEELVRARRGRERLAPRSVLITFDDAYADFADHAWPVLSALGLPVTLFVPTAFPGDPERRFWWDRLHHAFATTRHRAVLHTLAGPLPMATDDDRRRAWTQLRTFLKTIPHERLVTEVDRVEAVLDPAPAPPGPVLNWEQLNRLRVEGVALGAHSRTHPLLNRIPAGSLSDEIAGSIRDLERVTGETPRAFAYPGGGLDGEAVRVVAEAGVAIGFRTSPGFRRLNDLRHGNWLLLKRINVIRSATPSLLQLRLLPVLARLDRPDIRTKARTGVEPDGTSWRAPATTRGAQ